MTIQLSEKNKMHDNFSKIKNDYKIRIFEDDYTSKKMEGQYSL